MRAVFGASARGPAGPVSQPALVGDDLYHATPGSARRACASACLPPAICRLLSAVCHLWRRAFVQSDLS